MNPSHVLHHFRSAPLDFIQSNILRGHTPDAKGRVQKRKPSCCFPLHVGGDDNGLRIYERKT